MTYNLIQLAPGSYDVLLDNTIIGSVVKGGSRSAPVWTAELLEDLPPEKRPAPFTQIEHDFESFEDLCVWLGSPEVKPNRRDKVAL
jgi:hypothetical protein